jgi:mRNA-degrading endonuclease RelE of RelBE toxin-antitoxin system
MEVHFASSFERILKKLDAPIKEEVKGTVSKVIDFYLSSYKTHGLGVKRL